MNNVVNIIDKVSHSNGAGRVFERKYAEITTSIPYQTSWGNGTGYLDNAIEVPMKPGEFAKSIDLSGRRIIFVGTQLGTVVIFDRYKNQTDDGIYVYNAPRSTLLGTILGQSNISSDTMNLVFDYYDLSHLIDGIIKEIQFKIKKPS